MNGMLLLTCMLLAGPVQDTEDAEVVETPESVERAMAFSESGPELVFDVFRGEEHEARVELQALVRTQGELRFIEVVEKRRAPVEAKFPAREVCQLALEEKLPGTRLRFLEGSEAGTQLAHLEVKGGKLTGTARERRVVRNVPEPVATFGALWLRAALLPREEDSRERVTWIGLDRRGAVIRVDEQLVFTGFEEEGQVAVVEHREPRGRVRGTYRFRGSELVGYVEAGRSPARWVPYVEPEEDDAP